MPAFGVLFRARGRRMKVQFIKHSGGRLCGIARG
jgi:hypothetical protein